MMPLRCAWTLCRLAVLAAAVSVAAEDEFRLVMRAGFEDETPENFETSFPGGAIKVTDGEYSVGQRALAVTGEGIIDVERYLKYHDQQTRVAFHYKAAGYKIIRVLAGCVEEKENLYANLTNLPQGQWGWAVVRCADWRNVVPRHGGPECPFGERTGAGKNFRNLVFHVMAPDKQVEQPAVYLDNIVIWSGRDTQAPTLTGPAKLATDAQGRFLTWPDAKDNVGVAYYEVWKGQTADFESSKGELAGKPVVAELPVGAAAAHYRVVAVDYEGNRSAPGAALAVPAAPAKKE